MTCEHEHSSPTIFTVHLALFTDHIHLALLRRPLVDLGVHLGIFHRNPYLLTWWIWGLISLSYILLTCSDSRSLRITRIYHVVNSLCVRFFVYVCLSNLFVYPTMSAHAPPCTHTHNTHTHTSQYIYTLHYEGRHVKANVDMERQQHFPQQLRTIYSRGWCWLY